MDDAQAIVWENLLSVAQEHGFTWQLVGNSIYFDKSILHPVNSLSDVLSEVPEQSGQEVISSKRNLIGSMVNGIKT